MKGNRSVFWEAFRKETTKGPVTSNRLFLVKTRLFKVLEAQSRIEEDYNYNPKAGIVHKNATNWFLHFGTIFVRSALISMGELYVYGRKTVALPSFRNSKLFGSNLGKESEYANT